MHNIWELETKWTAAAINVVRYICAFYCDVKISALKKAETWSNIIIITYRFYVVYSRSKNPQLLNDWSFFLTAQ